MDGGTSWRWITSLITTVALVGLVAFSGSVALCYLVFHLSIWVTVYIALSASFVSGLLGTMLGIVVGDYFERRHEAAGLRRVVLHVVDGGWFGVDDG